MRFRQASLIIDGAKLELRPNRANTFDSLYVDFQFIESVEAGVRYSIFIHPKQDVTLQQLELEFELKMPPGTRFFANGYQSADESRWVDAGAKGRMRSWTYTCIRQGDDEKSKCSFLASLNERTGFTRFDYDPASETLLVSKDLEQLILRHSFPAFDIWIGEGPEAEMFSMFARIAEMPPCTDLPEAGWSSRYLSPAQLDEAHLLQHLEGFAERLQQCPAAIRPPKSLFLVDEGWQQAVGDWSPSRQLHPKGLAGLAGKIREKGLLPGLWIAPFVASADAAVLKKNPEWVLKDAKGRPVNIPGEKQLFALNFYHEGVREYLSGVFHLLLDKWGFELLRMSHLYAVALAPPPGKTRGAVMWEALEFLRGLADTRFLWAADAPLGACWGNVDCWDPGPSVAGHWKSRSWLGGASEKSGAETVLKNLLNRRRLHGTAIGLAPDTGTLSVMDKGLGVEQQQTYLIVQALLGGLFCVSGAFQDYSELQQAEWEEALALHNKQLERVFEAEPDIWIIVFWDEGRRWSAYVNLSAKEKSLHTANAGALLLRPFETLVLKT